jgi:uncharacterized protein YkwD
MGLASRVLSRLGFGTGALVTTAMILGVAIVKGELNLVTMAGGFSPSEGQPVAADTQTQNSPAGMELAGPPHSSDEALPTAPSSNVPLVGPQTTVPIPRSATTPTDRSSASLSPTSAAGTATLPGRDPTMSTASDHDLAQRVLDRINAARKTNGVPALTMSPGLIHSAAAHNEAMAVGCGLAHQCTGEADLGKRISAEGVTWTAAGENIGQGGPEPDADEAIVAMAEQLTADMLAETPPNDGHRRNILSKSFKHVGISLYRDPNGTVWMTQDFAG